MHLALFSVSVFSYYHRYCELDKSIIRQVNTYRILTAPLIYQALTNCGEACINEVALKHRLRELTDAQFLTKTDFVSHSGNAAICCYSVGYRGRGLLKALSENQRLTGYISALGDDPVRIKKILSTNQFLIRTAVPSNKVEVCQTILSRQKFKHATNYIFRPQAIVQDDSGTCIIESVRQNERWMEDLIDKLGRMAAVFKRKEHNVPLTAPSVTLIAENKAHMKEIMRLVRSHKYHFPIVFTCDTLTYQTPDNCTYRLAEDRFFGSLFKKVVGL